MSKKRRIASSADDVRRLSSFEQISPLVMKTILCALLREPSSYYGKDGHAVDMEAIAKAEGCRTYSCKEEIYGRTDIWMRPARTFFKAIQCMRVSSKATAATMRNVDTNTDLWRELCQSIFPRVTQLPAFFVAQAYERKWFHLYEMLVHFVWGKSRPGLTSDDWIWLPLRRLNRDCMELRGNRNSMVKFDLYAPVSSLGEGIYVRFEARIPFTALVERGMSTDFLTVRIAPTSMNTGGERTGFAPQYNPLLIDTNTLNIIFGVHHYE